ncbi:MAG: response regulator [Hydrogenibacillus schlegelii]|uniref:Response regulator n=1 Tax=Hydrogenibacillus schlegelii TaxID=1484 RepID=A0A947CXV8_HYDSH|nr:response regulator [Hydrogenibacillus schlegelii]
MARILIVEDNETNALLFSDVLAAEGHAVEVAPDGETALARLEAEVYDLILLDIHLPEMDGLAIARALRSTPAFDGVPIVALSAFATEREIREAYAAGFDDYLTKPIDVRTLVAAVSRHLRSGRITVPEKGRPAAEAPEPGAGGGEGAGPSAGRDRDEAP